MTLFDQETMVNEHENHHIPSLHFAISHTIGLGLSSFAHLTFQLPMTGGPLALMTTAETVIKVM
jgi:hypothetical protein